MQGLFGHPSLSGFVAPLNAIKLFQTIFAYFNDTQKKRKSKPCFPQGGSLTFTRGCCAIKKYKLRPQMSG